MFTTPSTINTRFQSWKPSFIEFFNLCNTTPMEPNKPTDHIFQTKLSVKFKACLSGGG